MTYDLAYSVGVPQGDIIHLDVQGRLHLKSDLEKQDSVIKRRLRPLLVTSVELCTYHSILVSDNGDVCHQDQIVEPIYPRWKSIISTAPRDSKSL